MSSLKSRKLSAQFRAYVGLPVRGIDFQMLRARIPNYFMELSPANSMVSCAQTSL